MTDLSVVFLGVISVALVVMAAVQVAVVVTAAKYARQAADTAAALRQDVKPLLEKANRISDEAARASTLAVAQVERVDRMLASAAERIDETLGLVQSSVVQPVRQGAAILSAIRAAVGVFRGAQDRQRQAQEDDEALFVG